MAKLPLKHRSNEYRLLIDIPTFKSTAKAEWENYAFTRGLFALHILTTENTPQQSLKIT
jgi:hypothetical protein